MNILFLTLVNIRSFDEKQNIYADLCRELVSRGHNVHIVCPDETGAETAFLPYAHSSGVLKVQTGRVQKTSLIRKGISMLFLSTQFKNAIKRHLADTKYDLVMYSTPPITLVNIVKYIKRRDNAKTYLLLKDIFPQNAVDLGMMSKGGLKAPIYWYFRAMEKKLYAISDRIGCMSQANVDYIKVHEPQIPAQKLHVSPNSFEPEMVTLSGEEKEALRKKYGLPEGKKIFIYGGNIGRPQDAPFITRCMEKVSQLEDCYFVICGTGTDLPVLEAYMKKTGQKNLRLIPGLPRQEYESFVGCCDVGLIFLDYRFTIPNFPSRLLSYMQKSMPVLACTDMATDVGKVITEGGFGAWCPSNDAEGFAKAVQEMCDADLELMGTKAIAYLKENYSVQISADIILNELVGAAK